MKWLKDFFSAVGEDLGKMPASGVGVIVVLVALVITSVALRGQQDLRQRASENNGPAPVEIEVTDFQFSSGTITVPVGTTVKWVNHSQGHLPHTSSSDEVGTSTSWDSGQIAFGTTWSKTFNQVGTYTYHCNNHPELMKGRIIVVANTPTPGPTNTQAPTSGNSPPSPTAIPTPTAPFVLQPETTGMPIPTNFYCVGSCPTYPPTPTVPYASPKPTTYATPTPTTAYVLYTPTPKPTEYVIPTIVHISPTPTSIPYASPTPYASVMPATVAVSPTMDPCQSPSPTISGGTEDQLIQVQSKHKDKYDDDKDDHDKKKKKSSPKDNNGLPNVLAEFIQFLLKLIMMLLGQQPPAPYQPPVPSVTPYATPTDILPTIYGGPTAVPTAIVVTATPSYNPSPTPCYNGYAR